MGKGGPGDKVNRQQGQGVGYCFHRGQAHMIRVNGIYNGEVVLGIGENNRNASGMRRVVNYEWPSSSHAIMRLYHLAN